ncbi:uncharacterized protein FOMMEDRAFT_150195 [Fomitiporia mediterranea MF3/22]|uniref:uncharacterized protein n=1 Tax=Fomitiporia mediterranea (strain MF3/22) TaxID=694068 RepID=UPI00044073E7|nr:uncharacterized protein FOMMEDRAFT_150195 [Fomitiporia mediterranea MF3/22]EJD07655.1 hypothetical protein FOMMEDRAFT_150195 [Fomitiporia mediterranea MF3/22]
MQKKARILRKLTLDPTSEAEILRNGEARSGVLIATSGINDLGGPTANCDSDVKLETSVPSAMELGGTELGVTDDEGKGAPDDEASQRDPALEGDDGEPG